MADTIFILVIGKSNVEHKCSIDKVTGNTNYGKYDIEYIIRINKDYSDVFHHDFTIVVNSKGEENGNTLHIDHGNYKRRKVIQDILCILHGSQVILTEKPKKSYEKPFIYLDPEICTVECGVITKCYDRLTMFILKLIIIWDFILLMFTKY